MDKIWYVAKAEREYSVKSFAANGDMPTSADNMVYLNPEAARLHAQRLAGSKAVLTTIPTWAQAGINDAEGDDAENIRQCYLRH